MHDYLNNWGVNLCKVEVLVSYLYHAVINSYCHKRHNHMMKGGKAYWLKCKTWQIVANPGGRGNKVCHLSLYSNPGGCKVDLGLLFSNSGGASGQKL